MEESLSKFMTESSKKHEEDSNIIKEIRASTDATIRNQGASIKTLELQIGQMSKVLQERGFGSLPSSTETNPKDQVKLILTATTDLSKILQMETKAEEVKILDAIDHNLLRKKKIQGALPYLVLLITNYGVTCEAEAKGAIWNCNEDIEENCYLLLYVVFQQRRYGVSAPAHHKNTRNNQFPIRRITLHLYAVCTAGHQSKIRS
ncbi:hypothetical protein Tco_0512091 [Tanacetum coccineum]